MIPTSQVDKIRNAIAILINVLNNDIIKHSSLTKILLFGSCARDEIASTSDVDICLVYKTLDEVEKFKIYKFINNYFDGICKLDLIWCSEETYLNGKFVFEMIREEGSVLYEDVL